jgi:glucose-1-phosphate thymidylyltransferase
VKALIPVAGVGTRLRPLTYTIPKALINVAGKPIVGHIVDRLITAGVDEFCFITSYMGDEIRAWAEEKYDLNMEWVVQRDTLGLGHAILQAEKEISGDPVFIVLGDTIFEADVENVLEKGGNSLGVMEVDDPSRFGVVVVEGEKVVRLVEKPEQPLSYLAISGLYYVTETDLLLESLNTLVAENIRTRDEYQLTDALALMLDKGAVFRIFPLDDWYDCGLPETVLATNRALLDKMDGDGIRTHGEAIIIPPVHIGDGVELKASVIGPHVTIQNGSRVSGSVVRNSIIGSNSNIEGALLDGSLLGDNTLVRGRYMSVNAGDSSEINFEA